MSESMGGLPDDISFLGLLTGGTSGKFGKGWYHAKTTAHRLSEVSWVLCVGLGVGLHLPVLKTVSINVIVWSFLQLILKTPRYDLLKGSRKGKGRAWNKNSAFYRGG